MSEVPLLELAAAIADRAPIQWDLLERSDQLSSDVLAAGRVLQQVATVHDSLAPADSFASSLSGSHSSLSIENADVSSAWGRLRILSRIGRGTFGDVYRALDPQLNRPVALKLVRRRDARESTVIEEARVLARVRHRNVVTVYGAERIQGRVGLWMEFIDGPTLEQEVQRRGALPNEAVAVGIDLCAALSAVHAAGLLHRDIKAQNVMRDRDGRIVLADFGAGRDIVVHSSLAGRELAGTPLYLAPELLSGQPATRASDIYALGVLLYYLATGRFPVVGRTLDQLRDAHSRQRDRLATPESNGMSAALANVINRATHPQPSARFATAEAFGAALARTTQPVRRRAVAAIGGLFSAALILGLWMWSAFSLADVPAARSPVDILMTRIDNRTDDPLFDTALEYALQRELSASPRIRFAAMGRVHDVLQLMKRPSDTRIDRSVGREVAARDGAITALLCSRIEKTPAGFVLTTQLINPADDSVIDTSIEGADGLENVAAAVRRAAAQLRSTLDRGNNQPPLNKRLRPVTTASLRAYQLYQEAYRLKSQGRAPAAFELARESVSVDPDFASGWILTARAAVNRAGVLAGGLALPQYAAVRHEIQPYLARAFAIAPTLPEWERYWVLANYYSLTLDLPRAVPFYEALLRLNPDHEDAAVLMHGVLQTLGRFDEQARVARLLADHRPNSLALNFDAARLTVARGRKVADAGPYIARIEAIISGDERHPDHSNAGVWLAWLPAYEAWDAGNPERVLSVTKQNMSGLNDEATEVRWSHAIQASGFLAAIGRLREAEQLHMRELASSRLNLAWEAAYFANERDDLPELRRLLASITDWRFGPRIWLLMRAGFVDRARQVVGLAVRRQQDVAVYDLAQGELALADGNPAGALPLITSAASSLKPLNGSEYYVACNVMAEALSQLNRRSDALRVLEECVGERPRYSVTLAKATPWMRIAIRLARSYRAADRIDDAMRIEKELRLRLRIADSDNPLLTLLDQK